MHHAFTTRYKERVNALRNKVIVLPPVTIEEAKTSTSPTKEYTAIWDTGATNSAISKKVADDLGLKPITVAQVHHADGVSLVNVYLVNIVLPNKVMVGSVRVTEAKLTDYDWIPEEEQTRVLVGMDIIGIGDLAVTNKDAKTTMSFRTPSAEEIDFIPLAQEHNVLAGGNRKQKRALGH